jgi:hypothetical protein
MATPWNDIRGTMKEVSPKKSRELGLADEIVIVSGLPRSGTSMMMNMLESGGIPLLKDGIRSPDEDNPQGYYEFERVKQLKEGDISWLANARGKAVKIISYLLSDLPETYSYRMIFMRRKLSEIIASQRMMLIRRGENPDKINGEELRTILENHLKQMDAWLMLQRNIKCIDIDYNHMLESPEADLERINIFLGNSLSVERMAEVIDPSLYRQRK